jgi:hypothetical protein
MRRAFLSGLLALAACATTAPAAGQHYSGTWEFHFETSAFVTDAGDGPYWLVGEGDVWPQLTAPFSQTGSPWGRAHVVVEGELSAPGQYGHLGAYARELRVTRVIETQLVSAQPSGS